MKITYLFLIALLSLPSYGLEAKKFEAYVEVARTPILAGEAGEEKVVCKSRKVITVDSSGSTEPVVFDCKTLFGDLPVVVKINLFLMQSKQPIQGVEKSVYEFYAVMGLKLDSTKEIYPEGESPERLFFEGNPNRVQAGLENYIASADFGLTNLVQNLEPPHFNYLSSCYSEDVFCKEWGDIYRASVVWKAK